MTKVVAGLEAGGLVKRRLDADDGRAVKLEATTRGAKLLQNGRRRRVARLAAALDGPERKEVEVLDRAAEIIERVALTI